MIQIERTRKIGATPEAVWAELSRFMHLDDIAPLVVKVDALTDFREGLGARRRAHFDNGTSLVEEVVDWQPNREMTIHCSDLEPLPLKALETIIRVEPLPNGRSKTVWNTQFQVKFGPFGWLMGQLLMRRPFNTVVGGNLKGLEKRVISG
ncbi:Polyketide cyclase / dehydrase and lipid transport [Aliiroseovarius halocynthiae]|uniref:SRPBCC family protein n=1 Tax=Aliiroseovarius halocynthiae TaxID=985055 RepID=UPI00163DA831|nr:SRPBCC family protein [Aliiroseovarius halocynthiae]SMR70762.1 Polyketide cyclase / dehydrase and lipid transport [Aliiroseovarius halocynthiae]